MWIYLLGVWEVQLSSQPLSARRGIVALERHTTTAGEAKGSSVNAVAGHELEQRERSQDTDVEFC
jgi:hypothetical protein